MNKIIGEVTKKYISADGDFVNLALEVTNDIPFKLFIEFRLDHDKDLTFIFDKGDTRTIKELAEALNLIVNELPKEE